MLIVGQIATKDIITVRKQSCGKVMFSEACIPACTGADPPGRIPTRQTPPPQQTATAADGTHPTGMHSSQIYFHIFTHNCDDPGFSRRDAQTPKDCQGGWSTNELLPPATKLGQG